MGITLPSPTAQCNSEKIVTPDRTHGLRLLAIIAVVLAIPILPFVGLGESWEGRMTGWLDATLPPGAAGAIVIGLLATDILLPVPSSVVSTFSGKMLGFWLGTAASWLGMTLGAALGFGLARVFGRPLARRLAGPDELERIDSLSARFGTMLLVLARPVPVFAEASVLLMGAARLSWWRFAVPVSLSNLGIAAAYAALGKAVQLPVALAASIAVPLLAAAVARWAWPMSGPDPRGETAETEPPIQTGQTGREGKVGKGENGKKINTVVDGRQDSLP